MTFDAFMSVHRINIIIDIIILRFDDPTLFTKLKHTIVVIMIPVSIINNVAVRSVQPECG